MQKLLSWAFFGIAIAVGCGGRTTDSGSDGGAGTGGTMGTGGTTVGGTTTGTGGTTVGGTTTGTGGTTVGGTTTGAGGMGAIGGTGGTGATGGTGPGVDWHACTGPGQCELDPAKCCSCGTLGLPDVVGVNMSRRDAYKQEVCGMSPPCPPCVGTPDPHLGARCESSRCIPFDVRTEPTYTKCGSNQDCVLRKGLSCCECGAEGDWVALSRVGVMLLTSAVCSPATVCPTCTPVPPSGVTAVCRNGYCDRSP